MRNTDLIIKDIKELVNTKGYIYAFCLILFEDFHVNLETIHEIDHKSKLSAKEASLMLGFIVQNEIDFSIPISPESVIELKEKTYSLMEELHFSFSIPQMEKIRKRVLQAKNGVYGEDDYNDRLDWNNGIETAFPIAGNINTGLSKISLYCFAPVTVTGIGLLTFGMLVVAGVVIEFSLEHLFDAAFMQLGKETLEFLPTFELL